MSNESPQLVLLDSRSTVGNALQFWADTGGYTTNLRKARLYSADAARSQHECRESDVPLRLDYLDARKEKMVDCQYLRQDERPQTLAALRAYPEESLFYAEKPGQWDGNAVYFSVGDGQHSTDVDKAKLFTRAEAEVLMEAGPHRLWSQEYIVARAYWRVPQQGVNHKAALKGTGIKLIKPRPLPKERFRCESCGKFCSRAAYYDYGCSCGWAYRG